MPSDRLLNILRAFHTEVRDGGQTQWCTVAARLTHFDGAGIGLFAAPDIVSSLCASSPQVRTLFELESTIGEGPHHSVRTSGAAINEPALADTGWRRWPTFAPLACSQGAGALFGFPLRLGAIELGSLIFTRDTPGDMTMDQSSDGHLVASVLSRSILATQAGASQDELADDLRDRGSFDVLVHQAAGMVCEQGSLSIGDALLLLRAHAYSRGRNASDVARDIVNHHLVYNGDTHEWHAPTSENGPPNDRDGLV